MNTKQKARAVVALIIGLVILLSLYIHSHGVAVFQPAGIIGHKERNLIIAALLMSMVVVVPVYIMLFSFAWKYREGNNKAKYDPRFETSRRLESIWWGVPLTIITILAVITWNSSRDLDPFKPIGKSPAMTIQVVALQWKWLFIYPEQKIATVNYVNFPVNTPINFEITSDAPMNSFWIPKLGGQIYAMSGMATHLNLEASKIGTYYGSSANISGEGFAGMHFTADAMASASFRAFISQTKQSAGGLTAGVYKQLSKPSTGLAAINYSNPDSNLFNSVINKYEEPVYFNPAERAQ